MYWAWRQKPEWWLTALSSQIWRNFLLIRCYSYEQKKLLNRLRLKNVVVLFPADFHTITNVMSREPTVTTLDLILFFPHSTSEECRTKHYSAGFFLLSNVIFSKLTVATQYILLVKLSPNVWRMSYSNCIRCFSDHTTSRKKKAFPRIVIDR